MSGERGAIALAVLWICTLILWMGLQTVVSVRTRTEEAAISFRRSQALYLAAGGAWEGLARIAQGQGSSDDARWQADGTFHLVPFATGSALVALEDESNKMDANTAGVAEMIETFLATGLEEAQAVAISEAISEYREFERDSDGAQGRKRFRSVDHMLLVPGFPIRQFYPDQVYGPGTPGDVAAGSMGLFTLFTVHGRSGNGELQTGGGDGSLYRVVSIGMAASGPPQVVIWMVVRPTPGISPGFQVLYRKVI